MHAWKMKPLHSQFRDQTGAGTLIDGYDKLKPFGFPIHACIDGYVQCGMCNCLELYF